MRSLWQCTPGGARNSPTLGGFRGSRTSWTVKTSGAVLARAVAGPDIGVPLLHLHEAAAAPRRRRIMTEQAEVLGFFGVSGGHWASSVNHPSWPGLSRPSMPLLSQSLARRGCPAQDSTYLSPRGRGRLARAASKSGEGVRTWRRLT